MTNASARTWLAAGWQGLFFAVIMTIWSVHDDHVGWAHALIRGGVVAVAFAALMGAVQWRLGRPERRILDLVPAEQQESVVRSAQRGVPAKDTALRPAAVALAEERLSAANRHRTMPVVVFAVFAAMGLVGAIVESLWWLAFAAALAAAAVWAAREPARLQRNVLALRREP